MLALTLMEFPTTVQFPVPTRRAPVTRTDEVSIAIVDNIGPEMASSSITASVLILPDPLQMEYNKDYITYCIWLHHQFRNYDGN
jgi:hypothetical protein